jgi:RNA polymerase sigma-70 factor (ECF subfamily)
MKAEIPTSRDVNDEDAILIREFRAGNEAAFTRLVKKYQQQVFNFIFHHSGRQAEVEDLAQEVFLKVYTHLAKFESRAAFRTWLYRITLNVCIDHARKRKLRRMLALDSLSDWTRNRLSSSRAAAPSPQAAVEAHELNERIQRGLERLPEEFRQALVLRDLEGLNYDEIAEITGASLGTVKSRISRGRERMRKWLTPFLEEAE